MNKVIMMGRLTRDPDVQHRNYGDGDRPIVRFTIAVDRGAEEADFFNCTAFARQAEFAEKYLTKGAKILVVGRIHNDNYTNREGQKVYSVQIIVSEIEFAESKKNAAENGNDAAKTQQDFMEVPEDDEDLPFA